MVASRELNWIRIDAKLIDNQQSYISYVPLSKIIYLMV
jgi:hypothetical protein